MPTTKFAGPQGTVLEVRFLGRTRILCGEHRIERHLTAKGLLVLGFLLRHQRDVLDRKEVAFALWPDAGESEARAALRRELYNIQRAFPTGSGSWLASDVRTLAWARTQDTWFDVDDFERLSGDPATVERAIELYEGPFAPQLDHEWASDLRERLARNYTRALELAIKRRGAAGDLAGTLSYVERLLAHDPWREDAVCGLILLRCRLGDRAGALSFYRSFCERLRDEFEVDPLPETAAYHKRIASGPVMHRPSEIGTILVADSYFAE